MYLDFVVTVEYIVIGTMKMKMNENQAVFTLRNAHAMHAMVLDIKEQATSYIMLTCILVS